MVIYLGQDDIRGLDRKDILLHGKSRLMRSGLSV
jgi:hypothetical protein